MPVAGVTTPATVEGFCIVSAAEQIAAWIAARAINPNAPLGGSMWAGTVDLRTGSVSYSAYDAMFYAFTCVEFLRHLSGISIPVGGGEYCDAKLPGLYAALEKAYKAMTIAAFTGKHPSVGQGMIEQGKAISPVQLLLERELGVGLSQFSRSVGASPLDLASIIEVGFGMRTNHLQTEQTLRGYRSLLWLPDFIERAGWCGFENEEATLDRLQQQVDRLIQGYQKPAGREEQLSAMQIVVARARQELLTT